MRCSTKLLGDRPQIEPISPVDDARLDDGAIRPGARLGGRYLIEALLSISRLHICYRAFDESLERTVTVRMLRGKGATRRKELRRQARIQNALDHPNIVRTLDFVDDRDLGLIAIVEEFVGSRTLRDWLKVAQRPLSFRHALYRQIMLPIASAMSYAHRHGIVHRNLKPSKIFVDRYDRPHITDFGLGGYSLPNAGTAFPAIVGTLEYLAPEQAKTPQLSEPAGDIYSLGAIFYEVISGQVPITGKNDMELLSNLLEAAPTPLVKLVPDVPIGLDAVILRCLDKIPAERHQSTQDLYLGLCGVLGHDTSLS